MEGHVLEQAKEASISAVVTRADGTVEQLGIISYWHRNPLRRVAWRVKQDLKELLQWSHESKTRV